MTSVDSMAGKGRFSRYVYEKAKRELAAVRDGIRRKVQSAGLKRKTTTRIVGRDVPTRRVRAGQAGAPLGYEIVGSRKREAVILVPATPFFNRRQWDLSLPELYDALNGTKGRGLPIVRFDYPGGGLSVDARIPKAEDSLMILVDKVTSLLDHLRAKEGIEVVHLFGYSLGAAVSVSLGVNRPEQVASIHTYGLAFPDGDQSAAFKQSNQKARRRFNKHFANTPSDTIITKKMIPRVLDVLMEPGGKRKRLHRAKLKLIAMFAKKALLGTKLAALDEFIKRYSHEKYFGNDVKDFAALLRKLGALNIPIKLGVGTRDTTAPPAMTEAAQRVIGRGEIQYFDKLDHLSFGFKRSHAQVVARDFAAWLRQQ